MSKWQCCVCGESEPCILHMVNDKEGFRPVCCPVDNTSGIKPDWHPICEPVTNCSQLPKLTEEVFERPDCPEWAKYAVVNSRGTLMFFGEEPHFEGEDYGCWSCSGYAYKRINGAVFDASDWENSLIERPAKLPDWCKAGEWVYLSNAKYYKIKKVDSYGIILNNGIVIKTDDIHAEAVSARLRPWRGSESLNKVVITGGDTFGVVIGCTWSTANVSGQWINCKKLLDDVYKQPDGSHCGVLEHLENGEWVK